MASFLSGLLGSYAEGMLGKHREERAQQDKKIDAQINVLKEAVATNKLDDASLAAAFEQMQELTQQKGSKKGGFNFGNLIGKFKDTQPQSGGGAKQTQPAASSASPNQGPAQGGAPPPAQKATLPAVPSPLKFRTQEQDEQRKIEAEKREFEQVIKPQLDYEQTQALARINAQYGGKLTTHTHFAGSSIPLPADAAGHPIDPKASYTIQQDKDGSIKAAFKEPDKPSTSSAQEKAVQSMARNIMADAQAKGKTITEQEAETQARQMALYSARERLVNLIETTKGKQFARKIREELASGAMSAPTARSVLGYARQEALTRFNNPTDSTTWGKSVPELENEIFAELGTTREEVSGFLRQGAKPDKKKVPFDPALAPKPGSLPAVPNRP